VFGKYGFVKEQTAEYNNEKGAEQESVCVKIVHPLYKSQVIGHS
jgi:hypothetical protein